MVSLRAEGLSIEQIGSVFGLTYGGVCHYLGKKPKPDKMYDQECSESENTTVPVSVKRDQNAKKTGYNSFKELKAAAKNGIAVIQQQISEEPKSTTPSKPVNTDKLFKLVKKIFEKSNS